MVVFDAHTDFGRFRVKVNDKTDINLHTRERTVIGKIVTVGGRNSCVSIEIFNDNDTAHFLNVKRTNGGCELDEKEIKGELTVKMVRLAFTIAKSNAPYIKYIELEDKLDFPASLRSDYGGHEDKSDFPCKRHDGTTVGISMALHELMFKQCTWYECNFKAKLKNKALQAIYESSKHHFANKPPADFDFNNADLNEILRPHIATADSWTQFFKYIKDTYDNTKCEIIFPWYSRALKTILDDFNIERQSWIITLDDIPEIEYLEKNKQTGGSRSHTRRRLKHNEQLKTYADFDYYEHQNHSYKWLQG